MDLAGRRRVARDMQSRLIRWVLPAGVLVLAVALLGGYEFRWSWTGITPSDQLWDLLHVIVLPVVLATLPLWYRTRQRWKMEWHLVFGVVAVAFVCLVVGGYALDWRWTRFQGNRLWDWLELLALPVVVASLPLWFATRQRFESCWRASGVTLLVAFVAVVFAGYALAWGWTGFQGNTLWDWLRLLLVPFVLPATLAWFSARAELERATSGSRTAPRSRCAGGGAADEGGLVIALRLTPLGCAVARTAAVPRLVHHALAPQQVSALPQSDRLAAAGAQHSDRLLDDRAGTKPDDRDRAHSPYLAVGANPSHEPAKARAVATSQSLGR